MAEAKRLYGLKAAVLAGATGISEAIVRTLAKHGATVLALDTAATGIENMYKSVRGARTRALNPEADDIGKAVMEAVLSDLGRLDIVISYIELPQEKPVSDGDKAALDKLLRARLAIYQSIAERTTPQLRKSPAGRFVSIGFLRSVFAVDGEAAYEEARRNLAEFTRRVATDNGAHGISANYIQPGAIMTRECRKVYSANTALRDYCIRRSATKRLGETVDVAKVALFLSSDEAAYVNGSGVMVDGGIAADG